MGLSYQVVIAASAAEIWQIVGRIGGENGYCYANALWRLRRLIDRIVGGRGMEAGCPRTSGLQAGDTFDFWRVLKVKPSCQLQLFSEMKTPGDALLDFKLFPLGEKRCELRLTARCLPKGLGGILYWYALLPAHRFVFRGMLVNICRAAGRAMIRGPERIALDDKNVCFLPR